MKAAEMAKKTEKELQELLQGWRQELATVHRERFIAEVKNVHVSKTLRQNIARTMTILRQQQHKADQTVQPKNAAKKKET